MPFPKPPTTTGAQIALLKHRGLQVIDENEVEKWLTNVSYYRLGGYFWPLQQDKINHIFIPGTTWEMITNRYEFDRELRITVFAVIERIEISVRTRLIYQLSHLFHSNWFDDPSLFKNAKFFQDNLALIDKDLSKSKDESILNHYRKYSTRTRPPAWKTLEILSLGLLSKLYSNLADSKAKNEVARSFLLPHYRVFENWLQSINIIRNICAHHGRLWDRTLSIPMVPLYNSSGWMKIYIPRNDLNKLFIPLSALQFLSTKLDRDQLFAERIKSLLQLYAGLEKEMGFPLYWDHEPVWRS